MREDVIENLWFYKYGQPAAAVLWMNARQIQSRETSIQRRAFHNSFRLELGKQGIEFLELVANPEPVMG
jgi:hypothetical protein